MPNVRNNTATKVVVGDLGYECFLEFQPNETKLVFAPHVDTSYEIKNLVTKGVLTIL